MNDIIIYLHRGQIAALGMDVEAFAAEVKGWPGVSDARLVDGWRADLIRPFPASSVLMLAGREEPVPGLLDAGVVQMPVDMASLLPWMAGDKVENLRRLVRAACEDARRSVRPERVVFEPLRSVLVYGTGTAAKEAIGALKEAGVSSGWAYPETGARHPEALEGFELAGIQGFTGRFTVSLRRDGQVREIPAGAVVLAGTEVRSWPEALIPANALSLSEFESARVALSAQSPKILAFAAGPGASTAAMERLLNAALMARQEGAATYVLAPHVKVAGFGLERLYGQARGEGVIFIRVPDDLSASLDFSEGRPRLKTFDASAGADLLLSPDLWVFADELEPFAAFAAWSAANRIFRGSDGFLGPDNVLFMPSATNRVGIYALGPARGTDAAEGLRAELTGTVAEIGNLFQIASADQRVIIDEGRCAHCLTCYRVCPHHAIFFDYRPWPDPAACTACGACAAQCPAKAITLAGYSDDAELARQGVLLSRESRPTTEPRIALFGCRRSAGEALASVRPDRSSDGALDIALNTLPCGGRLDDMLVFQALLDGADGVMIAVCHEDNCRTHAGSPISRRRFDRLQATMTEAGLDPERVRYMTLAPNMGADLLRELADFRDRLIRRTTGNES